MQGMKLNDLTFQLGFLIRCYYLLKWSSESLAIQEATSSWWVVILCNSFMHHTCSILYMAIVWTAAAAASAATPADKGIMGRWCATGPAWGRPFNHPIVRDRMVLWQMKYQLKMASGRPRHRSLCDVEHDLGRVSWTICGTQLARPVLPKGRGAAHRHWHWSGDRRRFQHGLFIHAHAARSNMGTWAAHKAGLRHALLRQS